MKHRRSLDELMWADIALPSRWSRYRTLVGRQQIALGQHLARSGRNGEAFAYLHAGLARVPADREGRLLLARLLEAGSRGGTAQEVLQEGLTYHIDDPRYLAEYFRLLFHRLEDERTATVARQILRRPTAPPAVLQLAALAAATAEFLRGNFDGAEDHLRSQPELEVSLEGQLLKSKINWERGHHELALWQLRGLAGAYRDAWDVHAYWISRLRHVSRDPEARSATLAFQIAHPQLPGPRLELLQAYRAAGELDRLGREIDSLVRDFAKDNAVLARLADFAAADGDVRLTARLLDHARTHGLPPGPLMLQHLEALVTARDFAGASNFVAVALREEPEWFARYASVLDGLQAIVALGLGDDTAARLFISRVLLRPAGRAEHLLALGSRLAELGAAAQAREILVHAFAAEPSNQAVLTRLVELDLNLNRVDQLPEHLGKLVKMRQPSSEILRVAQHKLGSDLFLFSPGRAPALDAVQRALESNHRATPAF